MSWTRNTTSGVLTHAGTNRDVWLFTAALPATPEITVQLADYQHAVRIVVRVSRDGRSCFECGILGANLIIRKVLHANAAAAIATSAHGLAAGEPFTLRLRLIGDDIEVAVVKTSGNEVKITATSIADFRLQRGWGVVSVINGALVLGASYAELIPRSGSVSEVLVLVGGGDLFACFDGRNLTLVAGRAMPSQGYVSMTVENGLVYMVAGGRARIFDPVARTLSNWVPLFGKLPGQVVLGVDVPGRTSASMVCSFLGSTPLAGMADESNAVRGPAIGEPLNWDYAEQAEGRAWVVGTSAQRSQLNIADVINCISLISNSFLFVGCANSMYVILGYPGDSGAALKDLSLNVGTSGPAAITVVEDGRNIVHSPEGLFEVRVGSSPIAISGPVLTEGIRYPRSQRSAFTVTLIRDASRDGLHVFMTPAAGGGTHFWYDEGIGRYIPGFGGFFPERYPAGLEPTFAVLWRGEVIITTTSGKVVKFVGGALTDVGTAIDAYCSFTQLTEGAEGDGAPGGVMENETHLSSIYPILSHGAECTVEVFGGKTAEEAHDPARRWELLPATPVTDDAEALIVSIRAPVLVIRLRGAKLAVEAVEVEVETVELITASAPQGETALPTPCRHPTNEAGGGGGGGTDGPGAGTIPVPPGGPSAGVPGGTIIGEVSGEFGHI